MAATLQGMLGGIREKQRKLQEAHERTKTVTRTGEMKDIRERMQADIEEVNKVARQVKTRLERLDKVNEQALKRPVRATHDCKPWPRKGHAQACNTQDKSISSGSTCETFLGHSSLMEAGILSFMEIS